MGCLHACVFLIAKAPGSTVHTCSSLVAASKASCAAFVLQHMHCHGRFAYSLCMLRGTYVGVHGSSNIVTTNKVTFSRSRPTLNQSNMCLIVKFSKLPSYTDMWCRNMLSLGARSPAILGLKR